MLKSFLSRIAGKREAEKIPWWQDVVLTIVYLSLFLAVLASVSMFLGYVAVQMPRRLWEVDAGIHRFAVQNSDGRVVNVILTFFNDAGIDYAIIMAACLGFVWTRQRDRIIAAMIALGLTLIVCASTIPFTEWFGIRPRPFVFSPDLSISPEWQEIWSQYSSFPSGHMRELTGLIVVLVYFWPKSRLFALPYVGFIAFSRVYVGAHFPYDVLGGMIIGFLSGLFALVAIERVSKSVSLLQEVEAIRIAQKFVFTEEDNDSPNPVLARILRSLFSLALLLLATLVLGVIVFTDTPAALADYLFHADTSLIYAFYLRFDPLLTPLVYALFIESRFTLTALGILILSWGAWRGKRGLSQVLVATTLAAGIRLLLIAVLSPHFDRARPFTLTHSGLPGIYQSQWSGMGSFPEPYLLILAAFSFLLAGWWNKLRIFFYLYPFLVAAGLAYFGLAWPIASVATVMVGYWVSLCSLYLYRQVLPRSWNQ